MSKKRLYDPYSTHAPAMAWALLETGEGDVLEMGAGYYSTPWLHSFCLAASRRLVTIETEPEWRAKFLHYHEEGRHEIPDPGIRVAKTGGRGGKPLPPEGDWSVVLIDGPAGLRAKWIRELRGRARMLVVHDTHPTALVCAEYSDRQGNLADAMALWPQRRDFTDLHPHTTLLW